MEARYLTRRKYKEGGNGRLKVYTKETKGFQMPLKKIPMKKTL